MQLNFLYFHTSLKRQYSWRIGLLKTVCYYKFLLFLSLRILPNDLREVLTFISGSTPLSLHSFLFKDLPTNVVYRSLLAAFISVPAVTLNRSGKKLSTNHTSIHFLLHPLYSSHCPSSDQRLRQTLGYSCPPPSHFYLMPGDVQSDPQGFQLHRRRLWLIGSAADI